MCRIKRSFLFWFILSGVVGIIIAWIDSRPNWDDTGISVMLILLSALIFGYLASQRPWMVALAISIWIPLFSILISHNYGGLLALVPGFAGAYIGFFIRKGTGNHRQDKNG